MHKAAITLIALLLVGCATGRSYHAWSSIMQLGYSETQMSATTFRVSYAGYGIPKNECDDYALLRAAELALEHGYKYFRIAGENHSSSSQTFYIPGATHTTGYFSGSTFNATSYSMAMMGSVQRPVSTFAVEFLSQQSLDAADARLMRDSLRKKHSL